MEATETTTTDPLKNNQPTPTDYYFEFQGTTSEFFKIWMTNTLLTIITLGIFSAWAKVREKRYFLGNTFLNGTNFDYHANPLSILIARIIIFSIISALIYWAGEHIIKNAIYTTLLMLFLPWAYVRGLAFNARNSSYCGLRFSFHNSYITMYWIAAPFIAFVLIPTYYFIINLPEYITISQQNYITVLLKTTYIQITAILTIFITLSYPLVIRTLHQFRACGHSYGDMNFTFNKPSIKQYYLTYCYILVSLAIIEVLIFIFITYYVYQITTLIFLLITAIIATLISYLRIQTEYLYLYWNNLRFNNGKVKCDISPLQFTINIMLLNYIMTFISLGILYPWAKVRRARYIAQHMKIIMSDNTLEQITAKKGKDESALGEELVSAEGFDFDIGLI